AEDARGLRRRPAAARGAGPPARGPPLRPGRPVYGTGGRGAHGRLRGDAALLRDRLAARPGGDGGVPPGQRRGLTKVGRPGGGARFGNGGRGTGLLGTATAALRRRCVEGPCDEGEVSSHVPFR